MPFLTLRPPAYFPADSAFAANRVLIAVYCPQKFPSRAFGPAPEIRKPSQSRITPEREVVFEAKIFSLTVLFLLLTTGGLIGVMHPLLS